MSWCSGHCAVGGALVAAAAGTAAVAGHRPFQQSEARTRSWAVGVELLASDGLPIAWPVGSMERAWAVSAWSSDGTRLVCSRQDAVTDRPVSQVLSAQKVADACLRFRFQKKYLGGAYVSVSARHAPASPGEACAGGAHSHMGSIHSRRCGSRAQASFTTTPPSTLVRCRSACPRKCIEVGPLQPWPGPSACARLHPWMRPSHPLPDLRGGARPPLARPTRLRLPSRHPVWHSDSRSAALPLRTPVSVFGRRSCRSR